MGRPFAAAAARARDGADALADADFADADGALLAVAAMRRPGRGEGETRALAVADLLGGDDDLERKREVVAALAADEDIDPLVRDALAAREALIDSMIEHRRRSSTADDDAAWADLARTRDMIATARLRAAVSGHRSLAEHLAEFDELLLASDPGAERAAEDIEREFAAVVRVLAVGGLDAATQNALRSRAEGLVHLMRQTWAAQAASMAGGVDRAELLRVREVLGLARLRAAVSGDTALTARLEELDSFISSLEPAAGAVEGRAAVRRLEGQFAGLLRALEGDLGDQSVSSAVSAYTSGVVAELSRYRAALAGELVGPTGEPLDAADVDFLRGLASLRGSLLGAAVHGGDRKAFAALDEELAQLGEEYTSAFVSGQYGDLIASLERELGVLEAAAPSLSGDIAAAAEARRSQVSAMLEQLRRSSAPPVPGAEAEEPPQFRDVLADAVSRAAAGGNRVLAAKLADLGQLLDGVDRRGSLRTVALEKQLAAMSALLADPAVSADVKAALRLRAADTDGQLCVVRALVVASASFSRAILSVAEVGFVASAMGQLAEVAAELRRGAGVRDSESPTWMMSSDAAMGGMQEETAELVPLTVVTRCLEDARELVTLATVVGSFGSDTGRREDVEVTALEGCAARLVLSSLRALSLNVPAAALAAAAGISVAAAGVVAGCVTASYLISCGIDPSTNHAAVSFGLGYAPLAAPVRSVPAATNSAWAGARSALLSAANATSHALAGGFLGAPVPMEEIVAALRAERDRLPMGTQEADALPLSVRLAVSLRLAGLDSALAVVLAAPAVAAQAVSTLRDSIPPLRLGAAVEPAVKEVAAAFQQLKELDGTGALLDVKAALDAVVTVAAKGGAVVDASPLAAHVALAGGILEGLRAQAPAAAACVLPLSAYFHAQSLAFASAPLVGTSDAPFAAVASLEPPAAVFRAVGAVAFARSALEERIALRRAPSSASASMPVMLCTRYSPLHAALASVTSRVGGVEASVLRHSVGCAIAGSSVSADLALPLGAAIISALRACVDLCRDGRPADGAGTSRLACDVVLHGCRAVPDGVRAIEAVRVSVFPAACWVGEASPGDVELWDARWRLRARVPTDLLYHTRTLVLDVLTTGGPGSVASARYIATATLADAGGDVWVPLRRADGPPAAAAVGATPFALRVAWKWLPLPSFPLRVAVNSPRLEQLAKVIASGLPLPASSVLEAVDAELTALVEGAEASPAVFFRRQTLAGVRAGARAVLLSATAAWAPETVGSNLLLQLPFAPLDSFRRKLGLAAKPEWLQACAAVEAMFSAVRRRVVVDLGDVLSALEDVVVAISAASSTSQEARGFALLLDGACVTARALYLSSALAGREAVRRVPLSEVPFAQAFVDPITRAEVVAAAHMLRQLRHYEYFITSGLDGVPLGALSSLLRAMDSAGKFLAMQQDMLTPIQRDAFAKLDTCVAGFQSGIIAACVACVPPMLFPTGGVPTQLPPSGDVCIASLDKLRREHEACVDHVGGAAMHDALDAVQAYEDLRAMYLRGDVADRRDLARTCEWALRTLNDALAHVPQGGPEAAAVSRFVDALRLAQLIPPNAGIEGSSALAALRSDHPADLLFTTQALRRDSAFLPSLQALDRATSAWQSMRTRAADGGAPVNVDEVAARLRAMKEAIEEVGREAVARHGAWPQGLRQVYAEVAGEIAGLKAPAGGAAILVAMDPALVADELAGVRQLAHEVADPAARRAVHTVAGALEEEENLARLARGGGTVAHADVVQLYQFEVASALKALTFGSAIPSHGVELLKEVQRRAAGVLEAAGGVTQSYAKSATELLSDSELARARRLGSIAATTAAAADAAAAAATTPEARGRAEARAADARAVEAAVAAELALAERLEAGEEVAVSTILTALEAQREGVEAIRDGAGDSQQLTQQCDAQLEELHTALTAARTLLCPPGRDAGGVAAAILLSLSWAKNARLKAKAEHVALSSDNVAAQAAGRGCLRKLADVAELHQRVLDGRPVALDAVLTALRGLRDAVQACADVPHSVAGLSHALGVHAARVAAEFGGAHGACGGAAVLAHLPRAPQLRAVAAQLAAEALEDEEQSRTTAAKAVAGERRVLLSKFARALADLDALAATAACGVPVPHEAVSTALTRLRSLAARASCLPLPPAFRAAIEPLSAEAAGALAVSSAASQAGAAAAAAVLQLSAVGAINALEDIGKRTHPPLAAAAAAELAARLEAGTKKALPATDAWDLLTTLAQCVHDARLVPAGGVSEEDRLALDAHLARVAAAAAALSRSCGFVPQVDPSAPAAARLLLDRDPSVLDHAVGAVGASPEATKLREVVHSEAALRTQALGAAPPVGMSAAEVVSNADQLLNSALALSRAPELADALAPVVGRFRGESCGTLALVTRKPGGGSAVAESLRQFPPEVLDLARGLMGLPIPAVQAAGSALLSTNAAVDAIRARAETGAPIAFADAMLAASGRVAALANARAVVAGESPSLRAAAGPALLVEHAACSGEAAGALANVSGSALLAALEPSVRRDISAAITLALDPAAAAADEVAEELRTLAQLLAEEATASAPYREAGGVANSAGPPVEAVLASLNLQLRAATRAERAAAAYPRAPSDFVVGAILTAKARVEALLLSAASVVSAANDCAARLLAEYPADLATAHADFAAALAHPDEDHAGGRREGVAEAYDDATARVLACVERAGKGLPTHIGDVAAVMGEAFAAAKVLAAAIPDDVGAAVKRRILSHADELAGLYAGARALHAHSGAVTTVADAADSHRAAQVRGRLLLVAPTADGPAAAQSLPRYFPSTLMASPRVSQAQRPSLAQILQATAAAAEAPPPSNPEPAEPEEPHPPEQETRAWSEADDVAWGVLWAGSLDTSDKRERHRQLCYERRAAVEARVRRQQAARADAEAAALVERARAASAVADAETAKEIAAMASLRGLLVDARGRERDTRRRALHELWAAVEAVQRRCAGDRAAAMQRIAQVYDAGVSSRRALVLGERLPAALAALAQRLPRDATQRARDDAADDLRRAAEAELTQVSDQAASAHAAAASRHAAFCRALDAQLAGAAAAVDAALNEEMAAVGDVQEAIANGASQSEILERLDALEADAGARLGVLTGEALAANVSAHLAALEAELRVPDDEPPPPHVNLVSLRGAVASWAEGERRYAGAFVAALRGVLDAASVAECRRRLLSVRTLLGAAAAAREKITAAQAARAKCEAEVAAATSLGGLSAPALGARAEAAREASGRARARAEELAARQRGLGEEIAGPMREAVFLLHGSNAAEAEAEWEERARALEVEFLAREEEWAGVNARQEEQWDREDVAAHDAVDSTSSSLRARLAADAAARSARVDAARASHTAAISAAGADSAPEHIAARERVQAIASRGAAVPRVSLSATLQICDAGVGEASPPPSAARGAGWSGTFVPSPPATAPSQSRAPRRSIQSTSVSVAPPPQLPPLRSSSVPARMRHPSGSSAALAPTAWPPAGSPGGGARPGRPGGRGEVEHIALRRLAGKGTMRHRANDRTCRCAVCAALA